MIFKIEPVQNDLIQSAYDDGMNVFNDFWGVDWTTNTPNIIVVNNRADFDGFVGRKTENWVGAMAIGTRPGDKKVVVFDFDKINVESIQKYTEPGYKELIKHELCHLFFNIVSKNSMSPIWLSEGSSICLSGQVKSKPRPEKLDGFLESDREHMMKAYDEGGFVVEVLIDKFGKEKFIKLVASLSEIKANDDFSRFFEEIYGFKLEYKKINELFLQGK